jgi:MinD superfamily P-loop ATPase
MKRVLGTLQHFRVPAIICINKADIYPEGEKKIRDYADAEGIEIVGTIPFDESIPRAMLQGLPVTSLYPVSEASQALQVIWEATLDHLFQGKER